MSSFQNFTLKAKGLYTFPNALSEVPDGALTEAANVVIDRDGVINPRRGFKTYGTSFGLASNFAKQLLVYQGRILRHWTTLLEVDSDGAGTFTTAKDSSGSNASITETDSGIRLKYTEANGNLYFTSSTGIRKISAANASSLSSAAVTYAGGVKALDGTATLNAAVGWLTQESVVAYRVLWGIKDSNNNVIEGVPSQRVLVSNPLLALLITDYNNLCTNLATVSGTAALVLASCVTVSGNAQITVSSTTNLSVGMTVTGTGVGSSGNQFTIKSVDDATHITMNQPATASGTVSLTFGQLIHAVDYASSAVATSASPSVLLVALKGLASKLDGDLSLTMTSANYAAQTITAISIASPTVVTCTAHGLSTGDSITISGSNSTPAIDGTYTVTKLSSSTFSVPVAVTGSGTAGTFVLTNAINTLSGTSGLSVGMKVTGSNIPSNTTISKIYDANTVLLSAATTGSISTVVFTKTTYTIVPSPVSSSTYTNDLLDLQTYYDALVNLLNVDTGIASRAKVGLTAGAFSNSTQSATADLSFMIPANITTAHFYQVYRTGLATSSTGSTIYDMVPDDELRLIYEGNPTSADLASGFIAFYDNTPESFREGGDNLYTNANSGEGILQANEVPPLAKDITLFKNCTFYANTQTKQKLQFGLLTAIGMTGAKIMITDGITVNTYSFGASEDTGSGHQAKVSTAATPAQEVAETAQSLIRVINRDAASLVYATYVSGPNDLPGLIYLEARGLGQAAFYVVADSTATANKFNPSFGTMSAITGISAANPSVITSTGHGLSTGDKVLIIGSNSTPNVDGLYTITKLTANTFSIPVSVSVPGTSANFITAKLANKSDNEAVQNRLYYSKVQQPEAVPAVNYTDVGPKNRKILRILPLRDSLFILTEGGVYRLAGTQPGDFQVSLFDSGTILKAIDSAVVLNNQIYALASQGVVRISDTGVDVISRPIEDKIVPLYTAAYTAFPTATFAVGYESDRAYILHTISKTSDTVSTVAHRFNLFTNTWVDWNVTKNCGVVNQSQDLLYYGASDVNYVEVERKSFTRMDIADREYSHTVPSGGVVGNVLALGGLFEAAAGDVFIQTQYLTISQFNRLLLMLDNDGALNQKGTYYTTLKAKAGNDLRVLLTSLATKLDSDSGIATPSYVATIAGYTSSFTDTQSAYNAIVNLLNNDANTRIKFYPTSTGTVVYEVQITVADTSTLKLTMSYSAPLIAGTILLYKAIDSKVTWAPHHFGDPSMMKHVPEATILFDNKAFTQAISYFATDLSPGFSPVPVIGEGTGCWGGFTFGQSIWGGSGSSAPFRTYVPWDKQQCRYQRVRFEHQAALELYALYGISMTYRPVSSRGYR